MDPNGPSPPSRRTGGVQGDRAPDGQEARHHAAEGRERVEQGEPQKGRPDSPRPDTPSDQCGHQRHDAGDPEGGYGEAADGDCRGGRRPHGLWQVRQSDLPRCEVQRAQLLQVGHDRVPGGEHVHLPKAVRGVPSTARDLGQEEGSHQDEPQEDQREGRLPGHDYQDGGRHESSTQELFGKLLDRGDSEPIVAVGGRTDRRSEGAQGGEGSLGPPQDTEVGCADGQEQPGLPISQVAANAIAHKSQLVVPDMFENLKGSQRVELMEVACEPDSLLASAVQARTGRSDAACRSSLWCGHDLATSAGLSRVLEQIRALRPKQVWISPPCGPYSPLQNVNQRTPAQVQDLKHKRAIAQRIYGSTLEIAKVCIQLGIHITVELSERCEAWRLPVFQKLRFEMGLYTAVTKGCAVGLKGWEGALMQKGWRIVTSHARLAEVMHKPCNCPTSYKHAKCEGKQASASARYTKEYVRLAVEAFSREGDFQRVVEECSGKSQLPSGFGLGLMCTCTDTQEPCGCCLLHDTAKECEQDSSHAYMSMQEKQALNHQAQALGQQPQKHTLQDLEHLLQQHPLLNLGRTRRNTEASHAYQVFGSYAFGNHYGLTNKTLQCADLCKYVNKVLQRVTPKDMQWTSFALNHGTVMPIHKDYNNDAQYPNGSIGFGQYSGGELWVEGSEIQGWGKGKLSVRENNQGETLEGREYGIRLQPIVFSPKLRHGTCEWKGDRWVLTVFVSRNWQSLPPEEKEKLRDLGFPVPNETPNGVYPAEHKSSDPKDPRTIERIKKQLYLLHCATGHSNPRHMEQALKKRGADSLTLQLAKDFSCPVCQEKSKPQPRNLAALEPLPPKLATISADVGHWVHPHTHECVQFMLVIDEGSRFRTARILSQGSRQSPNAQMCLHYLQEGWVQYFGLPRCLRLDPAGVFRSTAVEEWCDKHGIFLDIIPGEAHWKVGTCENAVQGVKSVMDKLSHHEEGISAQEALAEAITAFNHKELVRGFSPAQHILGQAPDETGRFLPACQSLPPDLLVENAAGEFERAVQRRAEAEKAQTEWNAAQRIVRAKHSRHRPSYNYRPGELVFYWRTQEANKGRKQPGGKHGWFLGPARILATESRTDESGEVRAGGAVWLVKGRSLLKASPEQLRRATEREEMIEALSEPHTQTTPWTFHAVAEQVGGNKFEDISQECPSVEEWRRAQLPEEEVQPTRFRLRRKRPAPEMFQGNEDEEIDIGPEEESEPATRCRSRSRERAPKGSADVATAWWSTIAEREWPETAAGFWCEADAAVEIEISLPDSRRGMNKALEDLSAYFVGNLKRRAVELSEKRVTAEEKEAFRGAKGVEIRNFIASEAFQVLPPHLRPDKSQAIGMRWILSWKIKEDGTRKAKARAVLLGYQDSAYEHRATTSPVMTRQTRQMVAQLAAWKRWKLSKGDVTGAFLQSRAYPDQLYCIPTPDICQALGISPGSVTRVQKACYGLVDAPLEWWRSVDGFLQELGFERTWADSCCWVLRQKGVLKGVISGHVDDFLFAGKSGDAFWEIKLEAIRLKFKWGAWDTGSFTQCGVLVEQGPEGIELSQPSYLEALSEIGVCASRRKDRSSPTSDKEKSQLRALLGGISWHASQVAPYLAAEVSLLLTEVSRSTVETIIKANILLNQAKSRQSYKMKIHPFREEDQLMLVSWVDAGSCNRCDGGSTQGIFVGMTTTGIMDGQICEVSPMAWHSQKIDRTCRSPGAAEAQAAINGEDALYSARFQWSELLYGHLNRHRPDETVKQVQGCVVTDSRNVYDKLETEVLVIKGAEKRTNIELLALKEAQWNTGVTIRWVHSEAQLANSLTKANGMREYELFSKMGHRWRLVEDASMMSARRRKEAGLLLLEQNQACSKSDGVSFESAEQDV